MKQIYDSNVPIPSYRSMYYLPDLTGSRYKPPSYICPLITWYTQDRYGSWSWYVMTFNTNSNYSYMICSKFSLFQKILKRILNLKLICLVMVKYSVLWNISQWHKLENPIVQKQCLNKFFFTMRLTYLS